MKNKIKPNTQKVRKYKEQKWMKQNVLKGMATKSNSVLWRDQQVWSF